ncbi:phage baseplate protein [Methanobrevibacter curvatus]|uniref:Baseplate structural protein Gp10 C-terminal domain-containing protein n=1 Tax=Methanobrevibacter curvatus TaxID=49547 RepID=A0A166CB22_9EURY|nr:hypothetical protein [Methanobrevibacter curvatus]KZX14320.1 hypothetical protein MBCUR_05440 [Methanobrevibacter curvatus]
MSYDNKNPYERLNDGVYSEYINNSILLSSVLVSTAGLNLPGQFNNNNWNINGDTLKALWSDITYLNGNTVSISNGNLLFKSITFKIDIKLSLFGCLTKIKANTNTNIQLQYSNNNITFININNDTDLTTLNLNSATFYIKISGLNNNTVTLTNLYLEIVTKRLNTNDNVILQNKQLDNIVSNFNNLLCEFEAFKSQIQQKMYPVGTVFETLSNTPPDQLLGFGTWQKQENIFRLSSGTRNAGTTGGTSNVTLSIANLPSHNHSVGVDDSQASSTNQVTASTSSQSSNTTSTNTHEHAYYTTQANGTGTSSLRLGGGSTTIKTNFTENNTHLHRFDHTHTIPSHNHTIPKHGHNVYQNNVGSNQSFSILPPFKVFNVYVRTA